MTAQWDFWNGPDLLDRRIKYAKDFKPEYQANGDDVQRRISAAIAAFRSETQIELPEGYASGWRPPAVNEATSNAGKHSLHLVAAAGDKRDTPSGDFAWWCMRHPEVLEQHGLYMEHPVATVVRAFRTAKTQKRAPTPWCHLTTFAPHSHLRCYFPDEAAPQEWQAFLAAGGHPTITYEGWLALTDTPRTQLAESDRSNEQPS